jgi:hypothetical protein
MTTLRPCGMSMNHTLRHMLACELACERCGYSESNWDNARKARDFVVTSVRALHDLDMLSSSASARCTVWTLDSKLSSN